MIAGKALYATTHDSWRVDRDVTADIVRSDNGSESPGPLAVDPFFVMRAGAIVVGAGSGIRAKMQPPKQYQNLGNASIFATTLNRLLTHPHIDQVVAVISEGHEALFKECVMPHLAGTVLTTFGGDSRTESVISGLNRLQDDSLTHVLIHDAVRPFFSHQLVDRILHALHDHEAVIPGVGLIDALWKTNASLAVETVDRDEMIRAQTPQGFDIQTLLDAYSRCANTAHDDAAIAISAGIAVQVVSGEEDNVKLTTPKDFEREGIAPAKVPDTRCGTGFDVHRFGDGTFVTLCGVQVPHDQGLVGHSDADVSAHAITDAIYGALAQGDIGRWFPPDDPQWKDADSMVFLRHAYELARKCGYAIRAVDCTIICEKPRIAPFAASMQEKIAEVIALEIDRVSIKATTSEGLGFTGRREGIASLATATLTSL